MTMALCNLGLPEGSPNAYATKETLDKLGWIAERLPKIAGTDVLVLSGDDLEGIGRTRFTPEMGLTLT